jgi:hypothetical protein
MKTTTLAKLAGCTLALLLSSFVTGQEINFAGDWSAIFHEDEPERLPGPPLVEWAGLPLNEAGKMRGLTWDPNRISVVTELQCREHGGDYSMRGLAHMRIERVIDERNQQAIAFKTRMNFHNQERTIWLDGRAHPPADAPHTWAGFSTAHFENGMMVVNTTHQKQSYTRRNGIPASADRAFTEYWYIHENILTVVTVVDDPVFYTEPLGRSQNWVLNPGLRITSNNCEYVLETPIGDDGQLVPHYLPGENPFVTETAEIYHLPIEGLQGGAETMYPEFREQLGQPLGDSRFCTLDCE